MNITQRKDRTISDWKALAALAGLGAGVFWLVRSKSREEELEEYAERGLLENFSGKMSGDGDEGLPKEAPMDMKVIFKQVLKSANKQREHGEGPWSIYWEIKRKPKGILWSVGDNFDRFGHIWGWLTDDGKKGYIFQDSGGDRIKCSFSEAKKEALGMFDEAIEYPAY